MTAKSILMKSNVPIQIAPSVGYEYLYERYHKIQTVFKRDPETKKIIEGEFACLEFEYLAESQWIFTEKIDGTNIRIIYDPQRDVIKYHGRTDNANTPIYLLEKLGEIFNPQINHFRKSFPKGVVLFGEGFGARIGKGGGKYISDGVDFILFDIMIDGWILRRENVEGIAKSFGIKSVPIIGAGNLRAAVSDVKNGFDSQWGDFQAEGIVARPMVDLRARGGNRIITKIKCKDFQNGNSQ